MALKGELWMKKLLIILLGIILLTGCGNDKSVKDGSVELDTAIDEREFTIGKSDKDFIEVTDKEPTKVRNDSTEKWKMLKISESVELEPYILSYNKLYMQDDSTAPHIIVNFTYKITIMLNDFGSYVSVRVHEYVDKEEHDAKTLGSGLELAEYNIYKDNGDIVDFYKVVEKENK